MNLFVWVKVMGKLFVGSIPMGYTDVISPQYQPQFRWTSFSSYQKLMLQLMSTLTLDLYLHMASFRY